MPVALASPLVPGAASTVFINEIHYDNDGTDAGEFIEIAGPAGTNLSGWAIELYNGSGGARYDVDALSGTIPNQQGGYGTVSISYPSNGVQNGSPDGIALVNGSTVVQFLSYEGTFTATSSTANGLTSTDIGVVETDASGTNPSDTPVGFSLQLQGSGTTYGDFTWSPTPIDDTPNAVNTNQTFGAAPTPTPTPEPTPAPTPTPTPTPTPLPTNVIINEADADTTGNPDTAEFVELYDGGVGNTSLTGLVVVFYNGNGDVSYRAIDLDGFTTNAAGYFTLGNSGVAGVDVTFPNDGLQNGQDAVAFYAGDAASFPNGTAVTTANLIDAVVYDTDDADDPGLLILLNPGEPQVNENAGGQGTTNSIGRCPNGSGGARNTSTYTTQTPTPDGANNCAPPPMPPVARTIPEIQGNAGASPFVGTNVITTGVVTLLKSNGFFLQTPDAEADADPATSQGIFVFTASAPAVAVGDAVTVTGGVEEFFNLTQVRAQAGGVTVNSSGNALPTPITFTATLPDPNGAPDQLERFEAMRVRADALVSVAPTDQFGETYTVVAGVPRPFREPGIDVSDPLPPGTPCCVPRFDENPEKILIDSEGRLGSAIINVTTGVTFSNVSGPLDFTFSNYKIVPEATPGVTANASASPIPVPETGEFTIASTNLENFFINGADFSTKVSKASLGIRNVMRTPDIIGVQEVGDIQTLTALAERINNDAVAANQPNPAYQAFLLEGSEDFPGDDIDVGFLVKTARVGVVSITQFGKGVTFTDPTEGDQDTLFERPPLVLRATVQRPDAGPAFPVTVMVNHPQSLIDIDDPVRGPRQREKRRLQSEFTANLAQSLQSENLVLVGDLNAFQFNDGYVDVIGTIRGVPTPADQVVLASPDLVNPDLTDLVETLPAAGRYSFVFVGNAQVLDHVLVDQEMIGRVSRFAYARNNADFPETLFANDAARSERYSDHDMPVAYFTFPTPPAPDIDPAGSTIVSESCPPSNGAIDPGERVTVNLALLNNGNAASSNLVATLQASANVVAPTAPQSYGALAPGNMAARPFTFTADGSPGQTITLTLQLQDGATSLGTATFSVVLGNNTSCATPRLVVMSTLSRSNGSTVQATYTIQNTGTVTATNVMLTVAQLGATNGTPLPQSLGNLAPGATSAPMTVNFTNSTPGTATLLRLNGKYVDGSFNSTKRATIL